MVRYLLFLILLLSLPLQVKAENFEDWKKTFVKQATEEGIDADFMQKILPQIQLLPSVVQSDRKQPEFHATFWDYMDKRITENKIIQGKKQYEKYKPILHKAAQKYGIPPHYILAFWGLETNFGTYMGNVDTLSALATLVYDKRRRTFFTKQLITFIKIMQKNQLDNVKGSWAGAFGHFQFMPTTFAAYAVDGDNDGRIDLVHSVPDAVESAAHYLSTIGWKNTQRWGREIKIPSDVNWSQIYLETPISLKQWADLGVVPADGSKWDSNSMDMMGELIMPMGIHGPTFLVYPNFRVMMKWNKSILYALSVGLLADRISGQETRFYAPRQNNHFSYEQAKQLQQKLSEKGYYHGKIDGDLGKKTRRSIMDFQRKNNLPIDGYATEELLNKLNS